MIHLVDIAFAYGRGRVLDGLTLDIPPSAITVLTGASGSGKSTVLRLIAGFEAPHRGAVRIGGAVVSRDGRILVAPESRGVAMVFQDLALWPHMTVRQTLDFVLGPAVAPAGRPRRPPPARAVGAGPTRRWRSSGSTGTPTRGPGASRAASASAWPWPGPS
jgi:iron(III) transport system ATP-binding protein